MLSVLHQCELLAVMDNRVRGDGLWGLIECAVPIVVEKSRFYSLTRQKGEQMAHTCENAWLRQVSATILAETQHKSQTSSANALGSDNAS
jgi:hypothetical protein